MAAEEDELNDDQDEDMTSELGSAEVSEGEGQLPDMDTKEMKAKGFYKVEAILRSKYRHGWRFLVKCFKSAFSFNSLILLLLSASSYSMDGRIERQGFAGCRQTDDTDAKKSLIPQHTSLCPCSSASYKEKKLQGKNTTRQHTNATTQMLVTTQLGQSWSTS